MPNSRAPMTNDDLKGYIDRIIAERDAEMVDMHKALSANTQLTVQVNAAIADLRKDTAPIVDAMKSMEAGIRTIGRIGRAGATLSKTLLIGVALWGAAKLFLGGASWPETWAALMRAIGK